MSTVQKKGQKRKASRSPSPSSSFPEPPKRPLTGYIRWANDERPQFKLDNPELTPSELTALLGKSWKKLSDDKRKVYNELYQNDKAEYDKAIAEYREKYPNGMLLFFISSFSKKSNSDFFL